MYEGTYVRMMNLLRHSAVKTEEILRHADVFGGSRAR
jgi:hypothetical protein